MLGKQPANGWIFEDVDLKLTTRRSAKQFFSRRGAIRLQEDETRPQKQALSVRADALDYSESMHDEKTAV